MDLRIFRLLSWIAIALLTVLLWTTAQAQNAGDPRAGLTLARAWCTGCHIVEPAGRGGDSAPTFMEIANKKDRTPQTLRAWLTNPHPPMPNLNLSRAEINDIIVYLDSLQGQM